METIRRTGSYKLAVSCVCFSFISVVLIAISIFSDHWEYQRFDTNCITSKNSSSTLVQLHGDYFSLRVESPNSSHSAPAVELFTLHNQYAGVWSICNHLSDRSQDVVYGSVSKCFDFMADYPTIKSALSKDLIFIIHMRNSAMSSLILDILMLIAAVITGTVGLLKSQLVCLTVTGVLFILTGFYTGMAALVIFAKMGREVTTCSGIALVPEVMCDCHHIEVGWSFYVCWVATLMCIVTFFLWIQLSSRVLRLTAIKLT